MDKLGEKFHIPKGKFERRERTNSMSIVELWKVKEDKKRIRKEEEERLENIFERSNKLLILTNST